MPNGINAQNAGFFSDAAYTDVTKPVDLSKLPGDKGSWRELTSSADSVKDRQSVQRESVFGSRRFMPFLASKIGETE